MIRNSYFIFILHESDLLFSLNRLILYFIFYFQNTHLSFTFCINPEIMHGEFLWERNMRCHPLTLRAHKGYHILWEGRDPHARTWKEWYITTHRKETRDSVSWREGPHWNTTPWEREEDIQPAGTIKKIFHWRPQPVGILDTLHGEFSIGDQNQQAFWARSMEIGEQILSQENHRGTINFF